MLTKAQFLEPLAKLRTDQAIVATMGVVRPWGRMSSSDLDFASADSAMGHAADLALGVAMAQPARQVICLNGDGSMLMSLGTLATIVESGVKNLALFVVVNGTYEITGNQRTPGSGTVDFAGMATAAGFPRVYHFNHADEYRAALAEVLSGEGPVFVSVDMEPGTEGPISRSAAEDTEYLQVSLADWARRFRKALTRL
jgi:thiamine pyrophosphate-dependent acetolactate synthase large subunit-like protein